MNYDQQSFAAFRDSVVTTLGQVVSLGVQWAGTRFAQYLKVLDAAATHSYPRQVSWGEEQRQYWEAYVQCQHLVYCARAWREFDQQVLTRKLGIVVKGAPFGAAADDAPRNTLLELLAAYLLSTRGFEVDLTDADADVIARLPGMPAFDVECKRPTSAKALRRTFREIRHDVSKRLTLARPHGIAVVGIDRILKLTERGLGASTADAMKRGINAEQERLLKVFRRLMAKPHSNLFPDVPLLAIVLTGAAFNHGDGVPVVVTTMALACSGPEGHAISRHILQAFAPYFGLQVGA